MRSGSRCRAWLEARPTEWGAVEVGLRLGFPESECDGGVKGGREGCPHLLDEEV
jgi:hypothetical protein